MTRSNPFDLPFPGQSLALQLPLWPEAKRGTPNTFLRSALFAATQGRNRRFMNSESIATLKDTAIEFTGEQLTQSDLDVWQALIHLARNYPLGADCTFSGNAILKVLNRHKGKSQRDWLHATMMRLGVCAIVVKRKNFLFVGHIIDSFSSDERLYCVRLNKDLIKLFGYSDWTQVDWSERMSMLKQPLAQWLHGYWSTHTAPGPIGIATLQRLSGTTEKHLRNFKLRLRTALVTLVELGFLKSFTFEHSKDSGELVRVVRSTRHLGSP